MLIPVVGFTLWRLSHRSACDVARAASGLSIPCREQVIEFHDHASGFLDQDLDTRAELLFAPADFDRVFREARESGFLAVAEPSATTRPCDDNVNQFGMGATGICEAREELSDSSGLFRYFRDTPSSYTLVVLDSARRRLVARFLIL